MSLQRLSIVSGLLLFSLAMIGCVNIETMNEGFRRIDRMWQAEYQKTEDEFRYRVIDADFQTAFTLVRKTLIELGMAVKSESIEGGAIMSEANAPLPLTTDEWARVVDFEKDRVKETGGWMFRMTKKPKGYVVTLKV